MILADLSSGLLFLSQVTSGTGFPVTLATNLKVSFSGTIISWKRLMNSGGSGAPLGTSIFRKHITEPLLKKNLFNVQNYNCIGTISSIAVINMYHTLNK